eukprot:NODE_718_length_1920_cov_160.080312_g666_i0.p1 GENE.NODE_718_length_1920_cov_160.080312_g666_i0~~NODE_718_length_1920_cov_160.080312_g666_i0.p1  ORF type:complete len:569 (-),score=135.61 NODE_718_length_1920_cov_160.080312_g666_i0:162-1868(-)
MSTAIQNTLFGNWIKVVFKQERDRVLGSMLRLGPGLIYSICTVAQNLLDAKQLHEGEAPMGTALTLVYLSFLVFLLSLGYLLCHLLKDLRWMLFLYRIPFETHPLCSNLNHYATILHQSIFDLAVSIDAELQAPITHHSELGDTPGAIQLYLSPYWLVQVNLQKVVTGVVHGKLLTSARLDMCRLCDVEYMIRFPLNTIVLATRAGPRLTMVIIEGREYTWSELVQRSAELRRAATAFPTHMQTSIQSLLGLSNPNPRFRPTAEMVAQSLRFMSLWMIIMDRLSAEVRTLYDAENEVLTERLRTVMNALEASGSLPTQAASEEAVAQLEEFLLTEEQRATHWHDSRCSMCLEEFVVGTSVTMFACGIHSFHSLCIREWLNRQHTCPLCRYSLPVKEQYFPTECHHHFMEQVPDIPLRPAPEVPFVASDAEQIQALRALDPYTPAPTPPESIQTPVQFLNHAYQQWLARLAITSQMPGAMDAVLAAVSRTAPQELAHNPFVAHLFRLYPELAQSYNDTRPTLLLESAEEEDPAAWMFEETEGYEGLEELLHTHSPRTHLFPWLQLIVDA